MNTLRRTHTPGTIFLTGLWTKTYPNAVRSFARDPLFELENHSWDHAARTPATAPAVECLIPKLRARGYRFVTQKRLLTQH